MDGAVTRLDDAATGGLGALELVHPPGTFAPSPATLATLEAVGRCAHLLAGTGLDWGCGIGVLALGAARVPAVERVVGLDIDPANVAAAQENARRNGLANKVLFGAADSYAPRDARLAALLQEMRGRFDFLLANAPASETGDGFDFRRRVMSEGAVFLRPGAVVLLQALSAYGPDRVAGLAGDAFRYHGVVHATELVRLDFTRPDLRNQMSVYVEEEERGGLPYEFHLAEPAEGPVTAVEADAARRAGRPVLGRWAVHRFTRG